MVTAVLSAFPAERFGALVTVADVQFRGDVLGLAPGFDFFSWSLAPLELLGPLALAMSRLAPEDAVPLTTGVPAEADFAFGAML